jgi:hypothetical protein
MALPLQSLLHEMEITVEVAVVALAKMYQQQLAVLHHRQDKGLQVAAERELRDLVAVAQVKPVNQLRDTAAMEKQVLSLAQVLLVAVVVAVVVETIFLYL